MTGAGVGFLVAFRLTPAGSAADRQTAAIESQVHAYFDLQLRITILPKGATPGQLTLAELTDLRQRVVRQLPQVMTGHLLSLQTQGFLDYFNGLARTDTAIAVIGGGVDAITYDGPPILAGDTATVSGTCTDHSDSYHLENGKRVSDGFRAVTTFTAQLNRQSDGSWLVSSMSTTIVSQMPA